MARVRPGLRIRRSRRGAVYGFLRIQLHLDFEGFKCFTDSSTGPLDKRMSCGWSRPHEEILRRDWALNAKHHWNSSCNALEICLDGLSEYKITLAFSKVILYSSFSWNYKQALCGVFLGGRISSAVYIACLSRLGDLQISDPRQITVLKPLNRWWGINI